MAELLFSGTLRISGHSSTPASRSPFPLCPFSLPPPVLPAPLAHLTQQDKTLAA